VKRIPWSMIAVTSFGVLIGVGCALTEKGEALDVRYYAAEPGAREAAAAIAPVPGDDGVARARVLLRVGRISASSHLGKKLIYRTSSVDVGIQEDRRWTERPDEYLRRSLDSVLFGETAVTKSLAGAAPTLDVELIAFEEIRTGAERRGRVEIRYALHDEREVLVSDSVLVEIKAASERPEDVVRAISIALTQASKQIAERVTTRLVEDARAVPAE